MSRFELRPLLVDSHSTNVIFEHLQCLIATVLRRYFNLVSRLVKDDPARE